MVVGFNADFGMNVRKYQFSKGSSTSSATNKNESTISKWETSVFTPDYKNPFAKTTNSTNYSNRSSKATAQARKDLWDRLEFQSNYNASKKAASVDSQGQSVQQSSGGGVQNTVKTVGSFVDSIGSLFSSNKKKDVSNTEAQNSLNKVDQASNKEELKPALGEAVQEQKSVQKQETQSKNDMNVANKQADNAQKAKGKTAENVNQSKENLDTNQVKHEEAKSSVQAAKDKLTQATGNVANAEQALAQAKSAATPENPNTAAINKAQSDLNLAKQEEAQAKKELELAEQNEVEAGNAVEQSETQVADAEQKDSVAADQVETTEAQAKTATQVNKEVSQTNKEMTSGIDEGKQKLEQMEEQSANSASNEVNAESSASEGVLEERDGNYYCNNYQVSEEQYKAAQSMDANVLNAGFSPGSTTDVYVNGSDEPKTFTVQEGKYLIDGQEVDSNTFVQEYNSAKANEESGTSQEISMISDDYSKYGKNSSVTNNSSQASAFSNSNNSSIESRNGTVDEDFKAKNQAREDMELALLRSKNGNRIRR